MFETDAEDILCRKYPLDACADAGEVPCSTTWSLVWSAAACSMRHGRGTWCEFCLRPCRLILLTQHTTAHTRLWERSNGTVCLLPSNAAQHCRTGCRSAPPPLSHPDPRTLPRPTLLQGQSTNPMFASVGAWLLARPDVMFAGSRSLMT